MRSSPHHMTKEKRAPNSTINLIGTFGGVINAFVYLPMIYTNIKNKQPTPLSWITLILIMLADSAWLAYAYLDNDNLLLFFSTLSSIQDLFLLYTKITYPMKKRS
jgi:uncharacterized protein with PQ loop repeat